MFLSPSLGATTSSRARAARRSTGYHGRPLRVIPGFFEIMGSWSSPEFGQLEEPVVTRPYVSVLSGEKKKETTEAFVPNTINGQP